MRASSHFFFGPEVCIQAPNRVSSRALTGSFTVSSTNTPNTCISNCAARGFTISGLEYGSQCFCGDSIITSTSPSSGQPAPTTDCSEPCTGTSAQTCGAGDRLQVYTYTAAPPALPVGWSYLGCYTDRCVFSLPLRKLGHLFLLSRLESISARTLDGPLSTSATNSPNSCIATCFQAGYPYAGVEYGTLTFLFLESMISPCQPSGPVLLCQLYFHFRIPFFRPNCPCI
jgi:hypothetical protein